MGLWAAERLAGRLEELLAERLAERLTGRFAAVKMPSLPVAMVAAVSKVSMPLPAASQPMSFTDLSSMK